MLMMPPPLEIGPEEGFTATKDIFSRASIGLGLKSLILEASDPLVLALDGEWGTGKSVFLKMFAGELRKSSFPVVEVDAFQSDYFDDAFPLIAAPIIAYSKKAPGGGRKSADIKDKAVRVAKIIARSTLKVGIKAATLGVLDGAELGELGKDIADEVSKSEDENIGKLLTEHDDRQKTFDNFRFALASLADKSAPLVIIIDELDRCRPGFALQIVERAKHFFTTPGVHFIFGVKLKQLRSSVRHQYGLDVDATTYLQKFFTTYYSLGESKNYRDDRISSKYIRYVMREIRPAKSPNQIWKYMSDYLDTLAFSRDITLRQIDRVIGSMALATAFLGERSLAPAPIIGGLCVLKVLEPEIFAKAKRGRLTFADVESPLRIGWPLPDTSGGKDTFSEKWWRFVSDQNMSDDDVKSMKSGLNMYSIHDRFDLVSHFANDVIDRLRPADGG